MNAYGGYYTPQAAAALPAHAPQSRCALDRHAGAHGFWGDAGCACFAF